MNPKMVFNPSWSAELNELLTAAVVNPAFQTLLLTDAKRALRQGYNGRAVVLTPVERLRVLRVEADNMADFVAQLSAPWPLPKQDTHGRGSAPHITHLSTRLTVWQDIHGRD